jgi:hypothetical protein
MNRTKAPALSMLCAAMLGGCGITGTIVDRMGFQTTVTNLRAEPAPTIRLLLGDAAWDIPLKSIETLEVDSINYQTINGEIYFPAQISFNNRGTTPPPRKGKMADTKIFVCAGATLVGKNKNGSFSISMDKVSKLNVK